MFNHSKTFSSFSVDDIESARDFYGRKLGMDVTHGDMGTLTLHLPGDRRFMIYPKPDHRPATFTILNFMVDRIEETVDQLAGLGIRFEQYEGDLKTDEKGIFHGGEGTPKIAWFRDPAGNILSVIEE